MDKQAIFDGILTVAKAAAPIVGGGAPAAIELGTKLIELIENVTADYVGVAAIDDLERARADLEQRVNAHVDRTVDKLRG